MSKPERKVHLNVFLRGAGHHAAAWRHPDTTPELGFDFGYYKHLAQTAERGLLDSVFMADGYVGTGRRLEPFTLLSALAAVTEHIGLIGTVGTTYNEPYHVARKFASLDHISGGRAGWNIVTGHTDETAYNFGRESHLEHSKRYAYAGEFVEVTKRLWDSWEEDAFIADKQAGVQIDTGKLHEVGFQGSFYKVKGHLNIPRPPQGYPVLVQAGSSESGKELAAATAEVIFTAQPTLAEGQSFYADVKSRLAKYSRSPDQLVILPGLSPIIGDTAAEAQDIEDQLNAYTDVKEAVERLSERFGVDLTGYPVDGPIPTRAFEQAKGIETVNGSKSRHQLILDLIRKENLTFRQLVNRLAGGRGHLTFTGTPIQLADVIEQWLRERASDGFNVMPQIYPSGLEKFVDKVVPELQNRGLFRTGYEGTTLRDRLGLKRPANSFQASPAAL
ncbi:LLM class flavin-dependent oxidoreductase [Paenibacillus hemerocallicola]|uniref:LLM class flavin-dependent oxidoreductase n=1 Tax=Paenibacillus hemerocallicola TaxID=1172614 RepID=A0A5C4THL0_9BACL|nr:LLM class flavin-dependent oxidoreductase [Paenibacillus hemerocallicola]TNJ68057.1 LLM class flavin-dependent oxidoreductase [Paenibacillus hemerocallicola]